MLTKHDFYFLYSQSSPVDRPSVEVKKLEEKGRELSSITDWEIRRENLSYLYYPIKYTIKL